MIKIIYVSFTILNKMFNLASVVLILYGSFQVMANEDMSGAVNIVLGLLGMLASYLIGKIMMCDTKSYDDERNMKRE
jgi:uncharacterized membrane protein